MTTPNNFRVPKLSICIPTYNQGKYVGIAVRSALQQEYEELEIVVSDNHSTDETAEYLASMRDERLRIVKPPSHLNKPQNFDFCISQSSGQYITVLCSDDQLLPSYAHKIAGLLDRHPSVAFAYSAAFILDEESGTRYVERHATGGFVRTGDSELRRFLRGAGCVFPTIMMRRQFYERSGGFSVRRTNGRNWTEVIDWDLQLRLIRLGDIAYHDEPLAEFRVSQSAEKQETPLRVIEETGWLYDTADSELISLRPELRRHFERARLVRASILICGLREKERAAHRKSKQMILAVHNSRSIRFFLLLHACGLSPLFSAYLRWDRTLRRGSKAVVTWSRDQISSTKLSHTTHQTTSIVKSENPVENKREPSVASTSAVGRVTNGVLANLLGQAINAFGQILLIPVFLAYWGKQRYGEWLTLSAAVTYLSMLDFGMQMFLVNRMNQCYTQRDYKGYKQVLQSALLFSLVLSIAAAVFVTPFFVLSPIESWFRFTRTSHATTTIVAILLCVQVVGAIPYGLISGCYRTIGEFARGQMVYNVRTLSSLVFTVVVIALGGGLTSVAAAQLVPLIAAAIWVYFDLRVRHSEIEMGFAEANLKLAASFLGPSFLFFLIQVAAAITVQGSVLMVGVLFGAASVAIFVPLRTLANVIRQLASALHTALWPEITALEVSKQYPKLRSVHLMGSKLLVVVSICAAVFLHFMGPEIVTAWTHRSHLFDARLFDLFLLLLVSQSPWLTGALVLAASNNHRRLSLCYATAAVAGLLLGYLAARRVGMSGIVMGIWIAESTICGSFAPIMACRLMQESLKRFLAEVVLRGVVFAVALYAIVQWILTVLLGGPGVLRLSLFGLTVALSGILIAYTVYFNAGERDQIRELFMPALFDFKRATSS